jgi:hypothetical protein
MDNPRSFAGSKHLGGLLLLLVSLAFFFGTSIQAQQQPRLSASYAKAARLSLLAIEADSSAPQDENSETVEVATTQTIDAAAVQAVTKEEESMTETLRQIYQLKRHDNSSLRAYRILMEVESAEDQTDDLDARKVKNLAVSQFADSQAVIMDHEEPCFKQLEQSINRRLPGDTAACSAWIQKSIRGAKTE